MQALLECTELKSRGHEVSLVCSPKSRLEEEAKSAGIGTLALDLRSSGYALALGSIRKFLVSRRIDVVHTQISQDLPALVPASVFIPHPPPIVLTKRVGSFISKKDPFHRWLYRHVSLVISISTVIHKNVLDTCPIDSGRVVTVFDGVDLDRFNRARLDGRAVRREFGLGENSLVIGMVGRFSPAAKDTRSSFRRRKSFTLDFPKSDSSWSASRVMGKKYTVRGFIEPRNR